MSFTFYKPITFGNNNNNNNNNPHFGTQAERPQNANGNFKRILSGRRQLGNNFNRNPGFQNGNVNAPQIANKTLATNNGVTQGRSDNGNSGTRPTFVWTQSGTKPNFVQTISQGNSGKTVASGNHFNNNSRNTYNIPQKAKGPRPFWKPEEVKALTSKLTKQETNKTFTNNTNLLSGMNQRPPTNSCTMMETDEYKVGTADVEMMEVDKVEEVYKPKIILFGEQRVIKVDEPKIMEVDEQRNVEKEEMELMEVEEANVIVQEIKPMEVEETYVVVQEIKPVEVGKSPIKQEIKQTHVDKQNIAAKDEAEPMQVDENIFSPIPRIEMKGAYMEPSEARTFDSKHEVLKECDRDYLEEPDHKFSKLEEDLCDNMTNINDKPEAQVTQDLAKSDETTQCPKEIDKKEVGLEFTNISDTKESQLLTEVVLDEVEACSEDLEIPADECEIAKDTKKEQRLIDIITNEVKNRLQEEEIERTKLCWSPLNVCQMMENQITFEGGIHLNKRMFWKLVISLPPEGSILNCDLDRFTKWLARKFNVKTSEEHLPEDETELCLGHTQRVATSTGKGYGSVDMCIRSTRGTSFHALTMQGASSILFYIRDQPETCNLHQLLEMESERLSAFLGSRPSLPAPTLTIIGSKNQNWTTDYVSQSLRLSSYVEKELIDSFNVVMCDDIWQKETSHQLKDCVSFMIQRLPPSPPLRTQPVIEFFETYLSKFFSNPVINNLQRRQYNRTKDHDLPILINMYNEVSSWLIRKVTNISDLGSISWPPSELCFTDNKLPPPMWNLEERLEALESYLEDIILLPQFPVTNDVTFDEACQTLNNYITVIAEHSPSAWKLASHVNNILERAKPQLKSRKRARFATIPPQLSSSIIPWTSIVLALVEFQLSNLSGLKDLNFERLLTVSYFEDLITNAPTLVFPPLVKLEESLECSSTGFNHKSLIIAKEDFDTLIDKIVDEKEANESLLNYLQDALDDTEDALDIEPKSKKTRFL